MRFNCGLSRQEKYALKEQYEKNWHPYFALLPRRVGPHDCRWLEFVERRLIDYDPDYDVTHWEWRPRWSAAGGYREGM